MDFTTEIEELLQSNDLNDKAQQKKAYKKCLEYADEKYIDSINYNAFVRQAATRCNQLPVLRSDARLVEETGAEKLHLTYSKECGPQLTGNRDGLLYLARLMEVLATANQDGEHIHLYNDEPPLQRRSFPLVIYYEGNEWFDKHAGVSPEDETSEISNPPKRDLEIDSLIAFSIAEEVPPALMIEKSKLYKILSAQECSDLDEDSRNIWCKSPQEPGERTYVFEYEGDDGEISKVGMDIDDTSVTFYSKEDLRQITR